MKSISYFVWQKRKLSDKPVEAGEDYTKFNSAEFVRKVSVYRAVCKSFLCFHPWFSSQSFFFGRPSVIGSVASLTLAFFKLCLGQSGSLCGNMLFLSLNWSLQHIMNSLLSLCKVVELSCWFFLPLIPAAQEDECCSEKSGEGGQDWHEAYVFLLQPKGQSRKEMNVVQFLVF